MTPEATGEQATAQPEGEGEEESKEKEAEDKKEEAEQSAGSSGATPEAAEGYNPHTSVKVHAPPGGASSITF